MARFMHKDMQPIVVVLKTRFTELLMKLELQYKNPICTARSLHTIQLHNTTGINIKTTPKEKILALTTDRWALPHLTVSEAHGNLICVFWVLKN